MSEIPKIIHYCWLGRNEYPELVRRCLASWREKLKDYEIKCWNEDNFDVNICQYTREAYYAKKYAYVSDYIRVYVLYHEGGIYLDTDVEVLKDFDELLDNRAFAGFETRRYLGTGILGSRKGNPFFRELLEYYTNKPFLLDNGGYDLTPNPVLGTDLCKRQGLILNGKKQKLANITVYTQNFFCPYDKASGNLKITENTYCIHYYSRSWLSSEKKEVMKKRTEIARKYGRYAGYLYYGFSVIRREGIRQFLRETSFWLNGKYNW